MPEPLTEGKRERFIDTFVASWIAARSASLYERQCYSGKHWKVEDVPAEDAGYLARMAWKACVNHEVLGEHPHWTDSMDLSREEGKS